MANDINFDFTSFDLTQLLPPHLQDNPFFVEYLESTSQLWKDEIFPYLTALSELRQTINYTTKEKQDLWVLIRNANLLGYKFLSNYMTQDNYLKLVDFISRFYEMQGTNQLENFIGFIRGASLNINQLWTAFGVGEYVTFAEEGETGGNTVVAHPGQSTDGTYYPTSHYRIQYNLDQTGLLDANILTDLFYNLAPIHFVLESVVASILFNNEPLYLDVKSSVYIEEPALVDTALLGLTYSGGTPLTFNSGRPLEARFAV